MGWCQSGYFALFPLLIQCLCCFGVFFFFTPFVISPFFIILLLNFPESSLSPTASHPSACSLHQLPGLGRSCQSLGQALTVFSPPFSVAQLRPSRSILVKLYWRFVYDRMKAPATWLWSWHVAHSLQLGFSCSVTHLAGASFSLFIPFLSGEVKHGVLGGRW